MNCQELRAKYKQILSLQKELKVAYTQGLKEKDLVKAFYLKKDIEAIRKEIEKITDFDQYFFDLWIDKEKLESVISQIERKLKNKKKISKRELRIAYETEFYKYIVGDEDIEGIVKNRDPRQDLSYIFNVSPEQVALYPEEVNPKTTKVYWSAEEYQPPNNIPLNDFKKLAQIMYLNADLTKIPQDLKNGITYWQGDIYDQQGDIFDDSQNVSYDKLIYVRGCLNASSNVATFNAPNLQTVGGFLNVFDATTFNAPNLQIVGMALNTSNATDFNAPNLQTVGGDLFAPSATTFSAPKLKKVGSIILSRFKIKEKDVDVPEEIKEKIEWED